MDIAALVDEARRAIVSAYEGGLTVRAVAYEIGISPYMVRQNLRNAGVHVRIRPRFNGPGLSDPDRVAAIVAARASGKTLEEVGQEFGCTREWVRQIVKAHRPELQKIVLAGCDELGQIAPRIDYECAQCRKPMHGTQHEKMRRPFCSRLCRRKAMSFWDARLDEIVRLRRDEHLSWEMISRRFGINGAAMSQRTVIRAIQEGREDLRDVLAYRGPPRYLAGINAIKAARAAKSGQPNEPSDA